MAGEKEEYHAIKKCQFALVLNGPSALGEVGDEVSRDHLEHQDHGNGPRQEPYDQENPTRNLQRAGDAEHRPQRHGCAVRADAAEPSGQFLEAVLQGVFTVPGDGIVPFDRVLEPLRRADYSGWLVVEAEQDPAIADPLAYATLGYRHLSALAAA